ncbi:hypothetical protein BJV74DRAFT_797421 [Russula compacta]|nr:hypothetical protein BJV74DRAFT_797421 [Russula compacta]
MSSKGKVRAKRTREGDEDDASASGPSRLSDGYTDEREEEDAAIQGSPIGHKRSRLNSAGEGVPVPVKTEKIKTLFEPLVRDTDGYVPGSIVRVQLHNFLTYDHVEFRPGPHLNMIIGPNGTGKSSIACAIALGLNWPPSILGRAAELNSFVKIGATDGYIEIELKGKIREKNLVVRRNLNSTSKGSTYYLNGQAATGREVTQKMNELNVQVGNLCSFLPQDKVSEFAHMSPQQLLRETQRAAGDPRLTNWHDTLIVAGKEMAQLAEVLNSERQQLKTLEDRNAVLERDVQRFNERKEFERQIALVELILPFMEYMEAKRRYTDAKTKQRALHKRVQTLQQKNQPMHDFKKRLETRLKRINEQRDGKKESAKRKFRSMKAKWDENDKLVYILASFYLIFSSTGHTTQESRAEEISNRLSNLKKEEKDRAKKIHDVERVVQTLQAELEKPIKVENMTDIDEEMRRLNQSHNGTRERQLDLKEQQRRLVEDESRANAEVSEGERGLRQLDDVSHRKLQNLSQHDPDCAAVINWLRANKHRFRMEIIEPAVISLTVPNKDYVHAVEACFSATQLRTFVAQCDDDYRLFMRLVSDTPEALGKKARITTWFRPGDANVMPPPMTGEEMRELGFDGYGIDFVDCPQAMRGFLIRECQLHRTPIALQSNRIDLARAMEVVSRTGGGNYIVGKTLNMVTRSQYGRRLPQNLTRDVRQARILVGPVADAGARHNTERRILQGRDQLALLAEEARRLGEIERQIQREHKEYKDAFDVLKARKQAVVDAKKRVALLENKLSCASLTGRIHAETQQGRLAELQRAKSTDTERAQLKKNLLSVTSQRADIAQQYAGLVRIAIKDQIEATKLGLEYLEENSRLNALGLLLEERDGEYQAALAEFNVANGVYIEAKERSKELLDISKAKLDEVDDDLRRTFQAMEESGQAHERSADQLRDELETLRQKLELVLATEPGVIEQYERRKEEIKSLSRKVEARERQAAKVEKSIKVARDNWHPALQDLITSIGTRFSQAFDRIGCAGELQLTPHDDYEKWSITILVKFRDTEELQQLTAHRQSGGERSLTTILYLMSMTEYARAPFSLVDEINQGMDQRAERAVHNELVKTTCRADSGQYFLITPKLLPDLKYDRLMKVLCVNNGEWLPEDNSLGNMMSMIHGRAVSEPIIEAQTVSGVNAATAEINVLPASYYLSFLSKVSKARKPSPIRGLYPLEKTPGVISLLAGKPNAALFPFTSVQFTIPSADGSEQLSLKVDDDLLSMALQYGPTSGIPPMVEWLTEFQEQEHGRRTREEGWRVSVTAGSQDAIYKAVHALVDPGDPVLIEKPVYAYAGGMDVTRREQQRRSHAAEKFWSSRESTIFLFSKVGPMSVHDPYYFMYFGAHPRIPSYFMLEAQTGDRSVGRVLRFDSFSKIISAGIRIGFVTGPAPLLDAMDRHGIGRSQTAAANLQPSSFSQAVVITLLRSWGRQGFLAHAHNVAEFYRVKRDVFEVAMRQHLHDIAEWHSPQAGMFRLLLGEDGDSASIIQNKAFQGGVLALPGTVFFPNGAHTTYVRASFSLLEEEQISKKVQKL